MDETERFLDGKNLPCVLVENKCDLLDQSQVNNMAELRRFANENEFCNCFRTSAKTGQNARNVLIEAAKILYNDYLKLAENMNTVEEPKKKIKGKELLVQPKKQEKKCC